MPEAISFENINDMCIPGQMFIDKDPKRLCISDQLDWKFIQAEVWGILEFMQSLPHKLININYNSNA